MCSPFSVHFMLKEKDWYMDKRLLQNKLFQDVCEEEIKEMLACAKAQEKEYMAEDYIFRQEQKPSKLFLVLEGSVMIAKDFASGKRDVLFLVEEGEVFGEMFLFSDTESYWYDAIAQGKVKTLEIPWSFFYSFCQNACKHHQRITRNMLEIQSEKNFFMTRKLHLLSGTTLRERIAIWLVEQKAENEIIRLHMKREAFADFLGTTRPSLSRELMKLQQEGLIEVGKNQIKIIERSELEEMCG